MILPIGDTPNPKNFTPYVNWLLIAANVAVYVVITYPLSSKAVDLNDPLLIDYLRRFAPSLHPAVLGEVLANISAYDLYMFQHGYKPGAPEISDLFYSLFLHGGLLHLGGNMLFLWIFGDNVEHRLGRLGYLLVYLATGVLATLAFSVFAHGSMVPLVGASGAISGVLGLYFLLFRRNRVKTLVLLFPFFFNVLLIPARWVLGFYVLVDNLLPVVLGADSGVAYGAHLGGFVAGLGVAWAGERYAWKWPWSDTHRRIGRKPRKRTETATSYLPNVEALRALMAREDRFSAVDTVARFTPEQVGALTPAECVTLSDWLDEAGHHIAAVSLLRRCLATHGNKANLPEVYLALGLMRLRQGQAAAAYQHLLSVFDHSPSEETARRAREALDQIDVYRKRGRDS